MFQFNKTEVNMMKCMAKASILLSWFAWNAIFSISFSYAKSDDGKKKPLKKCESKVQTEDQADVALSETEMQVRQMIQSYVDHLGIDQDPFALSFSVSQGEKIFHRLSYRPVGGKWTPSPLAMINNELKKSYIEPIPYNEKLIQSLIEDTGQRLKKKDLGKSDLQSNLLALRYSVDYIRRFKKPDAPIDRDGEIIEEEKEKKEEKKEQKKEKPKQEEEDIDPDYPELPSSYKPHTKDTDGQSGKKQKPQKIVEANFKTPYFGQRYFANIVRHSEAPFSEAFFPGRLNPPQSYQPMSKEMITWTYGKKKVALFVPPLHRPLQPSDSRAVITRSESGGYILEMKESLSEVRIPLVEDTGIAMMANEREMYLRPVGFDAKEWPATVQSAVMKKFKSEQGKSTPLTVAQAVADHLAKDYLYSVDARAETDPVQALKGGAFQCDMAAYAMISILRDVYQIPCRAVGGYRGKTKGGSNSFLILPGEAHVWVEVFHDGKWHLFDPTPVKKDRKKKEEGDASEYHDIPLENTPKTEPEEDEKDGQPSESKSSSGKDHKKRLDETTEQRLKEIQNQAGKEDKGGEKSQSAKSEEPSAEELAELLELGSLELEPKPEQNILLERAIRMLLQIVLDPSRHGTQTAGQLNQLFSIIKRVNTPRLKALYQKAVSAHNSEHPDLKNWIDSVYRLLSTRSVTKSYDELHRILSALQVYAQVLDWDGKIKRPEKLISVLEKAQESLSALADPNSQDIALVQELVKNLPPVTRLLLKEKYDLTTVGINAPTQNVAKALKAGKLNDLRLLAILNPLSDFILNSTPRPEYVEIKSWEQDLKRPRGRDLMPLRSFSDLPRAMLGQPGKSLEENIQQGTAFVSTRRKKVRVATGRGHEEAERITVVLYDTSGSMNGDPGRFQAGLIGAFTGRALSDLSPSGRHRHKVVIVPFDSEPGEPVPVTNTQQALNVLKNYQDKLKNTNGGTDIQKALIQAMALIADAEKRAGEPLAAANIILMTDGQANVNFEELVQKRKAISRETPLQTMFIAINQTNEDLMRYALDSKRMGAEQGFYREFTPDHIQDILKESEALDLSKHKKDFYTDKTAKDIPPAVYKLMEEAHRLSYQYLEHIYYESRYTTAHEHYQQLQLVKFPNVKEKDRPLVTWLTKVRQLALDPIFKDKRMLERVIDDLLVHFAVLTRVEFDQLSGEELEHLRHLVRYAAGLEAGI